jgi:hypothetical protein
MAVDFLREYFLADSAFAREKDIGFARGDSSNELLHFANAAAHRDWRELFLGAPELFLQLLLLDPERGSFVAEGALFESATAKAQQFLDGVRLGQEVERRRV